MKLFIVLFTLVQALIVTNEAHAYLDAGTGSYMIQLVLASVAAGMFTIKYYWRKIKEHFSSKTEGDDQIG